MVATSSATERSYQENIELAGRLSLRYQTDGKDQALDGKFTWYQTPGLTTITLMSPFGQTLARIEIVPGAATLTRAGQPPRTEQDVDSLAASALGWPLPIAGLRNWLQGYATDSNAKPYTASPIDTGDATFVTTPEGWLIHYTTWMTDKDVNAGETQAMAAYPKRIDLQRTTSPAGNIMLRIVTDQWQPR
jgi:outer membrane lipoprotein LolB